MKRLALILALLITVGLAAQQRGPTELARPAKPKTVTVKHAVPDWVRYETTHWDGARELWSHRPALIRVDGTGRAVFWWTEEGSYDVIEGGVPPQGTRWERSLRRVR